MALREKPSNTFQTQCWLNLILSTVVFFDIKLNLRVVTGWLSLADNKTVKYRYTAITTVFVWLWVGLFKKKTKKPKKTYILFPYWRMLCRLFSFILNDSFHNPSLLSPGLPTEVHPKATQLVKLHNEWLKTVYILRRWCPAGQDIMTIVKVSI